MINKNYYYNLNRKKEEGMNGIQNIINKFIRYRRILSNFVHNNTNNKLNRLNRVNLTIKD